MPNTQGENENTILTIEKQNNLDSLAETLKGLTINDAGCYESGSENANDAKCDPASNPKVATQTSDGKEIKVTYTRKWYLQQQKIE